jgi:hypothetical protein
MSSGFPDEIAILSASREGVAPRNSIRTFAISMDYTPTRSTNRAAGALMSAESSRPPESGSRPACRTEACDVSFRDQLRRASI